MALFQSPRSMRFDRRLNAIVAIGKRVSPSATRTIGGRVSTLRVGRRIELRGTIGYVLRNLRHVGRKSDADQT